MLDELCAELRNYFVQSESDKHYNKYTVNGGIFTPPLDFLKPGQYYRVVGSALNDGVYKNDGCGVLTDEEFEGAVWAMSVPTAVVALAAEIEEYNKSDAGKASPFTSESFGGYAYTKATDANGAPISWQKAFASHLNKWRKL